MDPEKRRIILDNKDYLSKYIDFSTIFPALSRSEIFTKSMLADILDPKTEYNLYTELVTRGPDAFEKFLNVLKESGYIKQAENLRMNNIASDSSSPKSCYQMTSKPLGFCKIINNVQFDYMDKRYGSNVDAQALDILFTKLGYDVSIETNLSGAMMRICLTRFSEDDKWCLVDSCVVIILSHGDRIDNVDVIYGTDSDAIRKEEIYEMFDNNNCPSLQLKPKLFLFQACRGNAEDYGAFVMESADAGPKGLKIPSLSDTVVVHSSLPNHKSYRNHETGSWFCQDFVKVFNRDYLRDDLITLLQSVDREIEKRVTVYAKKKQALHIDLFGVKAAIYFSINNSANCYEIYSPRKTKFL